MGPEQNSQLVQVIKMIACRFMDADGNGSREQAIKCIDWCLSRDVHVLSNSWGEVPNSPSLQVCSRAAACLKLSSLWLRFVSGWMSGDLYPNCHFSTP